MLGWNWAAQSDPDGPQIEAMWCTWKSKSHSKWRKLGPFGDSFTPSWAQRRHNMGNIASNEASSIAKKVGNAGENGRFEDFVLGQLCPDFEAIWTSTWAEVAPNGCGQVTPSAEIGAKWVQVGPKLGRYAKCANYRSPVHFFADGSIRATHFFGHLNIHTWSERDVLLTFWLRHVHRATATSLFRHLKFQKWSDAEVFLTCWLRHVLPTTTACTFATSELTKALRRWCVLTFWLWNVLRATPACTFSTAQLSKGLPLWGVFKILTSTCASRRNACAFQQLNFQKCSEPDVFFFLHFHFDVCFTPQRRALLAQLQKMLQREVLLTFSVANCASRHNGMQFLISHLTRWLRTRCFSEPTFRPSGAAKLWKNRLFRDFSTFPRTCIFFLLTLSSLTLPTSAFPSVHYCRKFDF